MPLNVFVAGMIALGCHYSAIWRDHRAGILAYRAARPRSARPRHDQAICCAELCSQAITMMLPLIASQFITLFKESALVSMISLEELMWHAQSLAGFTMRSVEVFTVTALLYMALTYPQTLLVNWLHRRAVISVR
jgi:polar amino acid transport system permease protein